VIHCYYSHAQLQSCFDGWDVEIIQLAPERFRSVARSVTFPSFRILWLESGKRIVIRGTTPATLDCLIFCASHSTPARWLGEALDTRHFAVMGRRAPVDIFLPADTTLCIISMTFLEAVPARRVQLRSADPQYVSELLTFAQAASGGGTPDRRCTIGEIDDALTRRIRATVETSEILAPGLSSRNLRASAVARACRYIESRLAKPVSLAELSKHCGVGVRTLEYGFRQFYDTSPISFIKSQRLTRTNDALMHAVAPATSISKIARCAGFTHMGQYCQDYRALFGESPSMTLHRALSSVSAVTGPDQRRQSE
jgi:AraC-like DNA-binding protein